MLPKRARISSVLPLLVAFAFFATAAFGQCPDADSDGLPGAIISPGRLEVNEDAAIEGSCGLEVLFDGTSTQRYVSTDSPNLETTYRVFFSINLNTLTMAGATQSQNKHVVFQAGALSARGLKPALRILIRKIGTSYYLRALSGVTNSDKRRYTEWVELAPEGDLADHTVLAEWQVAPQPGTTGFIRLTIDGVRMSEKLGIKSNSMRVFSATFGARLGIDATTSGSYYLDDFQSFRTLAP